MVKERGVMAVNKRMLLYALLAIVCVVLIAELAFSLARQRSRAREYARAQQRSARTGKPLLVIGDPYNGYGSRFFGAAYGCGDVCSDLTGCPRCPPRVEKRTTTLPRGLEDVPDDSHVVFISYVLEYVEQYPETVRELARIGGQDIFLLRVQPWCLTSRLYPGTKRVLYTDPFQHRP